MLTRAIVERVLSEYTYKVRIPIFDRIQGDAEHTDFANLREAVACVPKGINNSINEGDIVFVMFENNSMTDLVIIGQLYREAITNMPDSAINCRALNVSEKVQLPKDIMIGEIDYSKLFMLANLTSDVQAQLDDLAAKIDALK